MILLEPPLKSCRSSNDTISTTGDEVPVTSSSLVSSSSHISSPQPNSGILSTLSSSFPHQSKCIRFQQSLMIFINLHLLNSLVKSSLQTNYSDRLSSLPRMGKQLLIFFKKVGYVSIGCFNSALLSTRVFFQRNTLHIAHKALPHVNSFASLLGSR
ncbi:hypothetical protein GEMRC1_007372 [Eukaryota sp. GEM-RC1]